MRKKEFKKYGRLTINKLDWLLAFAFCLFALSSLWISIGVSTSSSIDSAIQAFKHFGRALCFKVNAAQYGQAAVLYAYVSTIVYGSLLVLLVGACYFYKKGIKNRFPGLFAQFVSFVGFTFFLCFSFEYTVGQSKGIMFGVWPNGLIFFMVLFLFLGGYSIYLTFNLKQDLSLKKDKEPENPSLNYVYEYKDEEEKPVTEKVEEEPSEPVKEEEPAPAPKEEEPAPAPVEEKKEEVKEELPEEDADPFSGLGKRRKRVPFENMVKHSKPETKERYKLIVNEIRKYDLNDRKSIPGEAFSYKKERLVFLTFSGKTLRVYFKLNPKKFVDSTIPVKDASDIKKYVDTPSYLVIKSDLAARRAVKLAKEVLKNTKVPLK